MKEKEMPKENIVYASLHDCFNNISKLIASFDGPDFQDEISNSVFDDVYNRLGELNNYITSPKHVITGLYLVNNDPMSKDLKKNNDHYWFAFDRIENQYGEAKKIIQLISDDVNRHVHPYESDAGKEFLKNIHHLFISVINVNKQELNRLKKLDIPNFEECQDKKQRLLDLMHSFHDFMVNTDIQLKSKLTDSDAKEDETNENLSKINYADSDFTDNVELYAPVLFSDESIHTDNAPSPIIHRPE